MLKIGLTGGIGSGKSTVAKIFEVLGIPVYYADDAAKQIMNTDKELKSALIKHFGDQTYQNDELNRPWLASVVFGDTEKLKLLNSLTHPATITINPAAGPLMVCLDPAKRLTNIPPMIAVNTPMIGGKSEACAIPRLSGKANNETISPEIRSFHQFCFKPLIPSSGISVLVFI